MFYQTKSLFDCVYIKVLSGFIKHMELTYKCMVWIVSTLLSLFRLTFLFSGGSMDPSPLATTEVCFGLDG